jgi:lipoprotein signal peptidase
VLAVLAGVILVDQLSKWWAWRHIPGAVVNMGATWFLGGTLSSWYSGHLSGAVLDLVSTQVLAFGLFALLRRPRPLPVLLPAACALAGWGGNLGDRLGLHLLTAPGMPRGAVDFIHSFRVTYNVADVCIVAGSLLLGAGALYRRCRGRGAAPATTAAAADAARSRPWRRAGRWAVLAAVTPALLGTAATLTATGGHLHISGAPATSSQTSFRPTSTPVLEQR